MDGSWTEIGSVLSVTLECLGKDTVIPIISVEIGSFRLCQHLEKLRLTNGKCKVIHK